MRWVAAVFTAAACGAAAQSTELSPGADAVRFEAPQTRYFTFPGRAGEGVSIFVTGLAHTPKVESNSRLQVLGTDGVKVLHGLGCRAEGEGGFLCKVRLPKLPSSGRYVIAIHPPPRSTATGAVAVVGDQACWLEPGAPTVVSIKQPGQVARCTFTARAGEKIALRMSDVQRSAEGAKAVVYVGIHKPAADPYATWMARHSLDWRARSGSMTVPPFLESGTYEVEIDPGLVALPSITIEVVRP